MSKLPSMSLYVDDFEADTVHLSLEEDGAYNRLLRLCWRSPDCSVPNDPEWIARRLRVTAEEFSRVVEPVISEFFHREKGRVWQKRQRQEYQYAIDVTLKRQAAGSKGGISKALKRKDIDPSKALASTSTSTSTSSKKETSFPKKTGSRLPVDFVPDQTWSLAQGLSIPTLETELKKFKNYWTAKSGKDATKLDWQATWRNWIIKVCEDRGGRQDGKQTVAEYALDKLRSENNAETGSFNGSTRLLESGDHARDHKGASLLDLLASASHKRG